MAAVWVCWIPCTEALAETVNVDELGVWPVGADRVRIENAPVVTCGGLKLAVTPAGRPEMLNEADWVKPFEVVNSTCANELCPGSRVTEAGPAVTEKEDDETTDNTLEDTVFRPSTVIVTAPVAAPEGRTKESAPELALDSGATIVPPPSWFNVISGENPVCAKPEPWTVMSVPMGAEEGLKLVIVVATMRVALTDCDAVFPATSVASTVIVSTPAVSGTAQL
jgi:hypothetical protein